jgi:hypothetical protein
VLRRHQAAVETKKQSSLRKLHLVTNRFDDEVDLHFTPLARDNERNSVIVMFEVQQDSKAKRNARNRAGTNKKASAATKNNKKEKK